MAPAGTAYRAQAALRSSDLASLASELRGDLDEQDCVRFTHAGASFELRLRSGRTIVLRPSSHALRGADLVFARHSKPTALPRVLFRSRTRTDALLSCVRLQPRLRVADSIFEACVAVQSSAATEPLVALVTTSGIREVLVRLCEAPGMQHVRIEPDGSVEASLRWTGPGSLPADALKQHAEDLIALQRVVPPQMARSSTLGPILSLCLAPIVLHFAIVFGGFAFMRSPIDELPLWVFGVAGALWACLVLVSLAIAWGRENAVRNVAVGALAGSLGSLFLSMSALGALNSLDFSAPQAHLTTVLSRGKSTGKSTRYWVVVKNWRPGSSQRSVAVDRATWDSLPEGAGARVTTSPGLLGWELLHRVAPTTAAPP